MTDLEDDISLEFDPEVEAAIAELLPSNDPLHCKEFSAIDYINTIFPTEQSLTNIDDVVSWSIILFKITKSLYLNLTALSQIGFWIGL